MTTHPPTTPTVAILGATGASGVAETYGTTALP
jgi:hypothetical protein